MESVTRLPPGTICSVTVRATSLHMSRIKWQGLQEKCTRVERFSCVCYHAPFAVYVMMIDIHNSIATHTVEPAIDVKQRTKQAQSSSPVIQSIILPTETHTEVITLQSWSLHVHESLYCSNSLWMLQFTSQGLLLKEHCFFPIVIYVTKNPLLLCVALVSKLPNGHTLAHLDKILTKITNPSLHSIVWGRGLDND